MLQKLSCCTSFCCVKCILRSIELKMVRFDGLKCVWCATTLSRPKILMLFIRVHKSNMLCTYCTMYMRSTWNEYINVVALICTNGKKCIWYYVMHIGISFVWYELNIFFIIYRYTEHFSFLLYHATMQVIYNFYWTL